jgi:1,2-diacylglycerol 3-alpha-glucosyltransferase
VTPRRIALVAACPFPSLQGSQVFVGQMAERLAAAGHDVHLLTYGQGAEQVGRGYRHHRIARLPGDDSRRSGPNAAKPVLDAMLAARLVSLVRRERIDLVHAHNYEAAAAALVAKIATRVPVVYHSHNLMGDELATYYSRPLARRAAMLAGALLDREIPRRADAVVALCAWSAARLLEAGCPAARLHVIPPAVADDGAVPDGAAARRALGIADGDYVVGYVGNLDAYQNLPLLLEAFGRLRRSCPGGDGRQAAESAAGEAGRDAGGGETLVGQGGAGGAPRARARLLIATHSRSADFRRFAAAYGFGDALLVVDATGYAEARLAITASDVLALPRRLGSGYPVKLLNFMSAGRAVVSAGCGSKVLRDGVDGLVVGDDDPDAFAAALDRCRADPALRAQLGKQARQSFLAGMTWEAVLPQIEGVYAGLREQGVHPERRGS